CVPLSRDDRARFGLADIRASGNTGGGASLARAGRFVAKLAFGIQDPGTDEDRTIHAFARAAGKGRGVFPCGLHALLRLLFSWRNVSFSDSSAAGGRQISA